MQKKKKIYASIKFMQYKDIYWHLVWALFPNHLSQEANVHLCHISRHVIWQDVVVACNAVCSLITDCLFTPPNFFRCIFSAPVAHFWFCPCKLWWSVTPFSELFSYIVKHRSNWEIKIKLQPKYNKRRSLHFRTSSVPTFFVSGHFVYTFIFFIIRTFPTRRISVRC